MPDEKMTQSRPVENVTVAMIGTGDGGKLPTGTEAVTPDPHQPNIVVKVVTPVLAILIRFANAYVTALIGLVTVGLTTDALPAADFGVLVIRCTGLAIAGPAVSLAKDIVTILGGLEKKYPLATGSV